ncbi:hypothetical protein ACFL4G_11035 [Thermodesulfobacteriota bacterium]
MPFVRIPGLPGKVYVPEACACGPRKHDCADCYQCQMCNDDKCRACLKEKGCAKTARKKGEKP